ncbi:MAG: endopeptidase La [Acidobacteria bacterium]|nr:endopeptidase La [Acidobacteriota bacterium]
MEKSLNNANAAEQEEIVTLPDLLPVLPLKDTVVFPYIIVPLSIGRDKSVLAVDEALTANRIVMLTAQKDPEVEDPQQADLYELGTAAVIMRMLKLPDGRIRILVQGLTRARIQHFSQTEPFLQARIERLDDTPAEGPKLEVEALIRSVKDGLERVVQLGKGVSPEVVVIAANLEDGGRLADLVASNMDLKTDEAQEILRTVSPVGRLELVNASLAREVQVLTMQQEISTQARGEMDKSQRDYFLRQQLKAIRDELGEGDDLADDLDNYRKLALEKGLSEEAGKELETQLKKLERGHPESAETSIVRNYLDWLTALPWSKVSTDILNLTRARRVLDEDHYDLSEVKDRILEYLAVRKLNPDVKGPILCFVGPPGVGKTSLGRSIARAMGRKFLRVSLGGIRDEAEIRGHRRTYVGAMPGRILQGLRQAETSNPVFMLDEIDKLGTDYRGDPSSALLEVLDPEQNSTFRDHYLSVAYDLRRVVFITTANQLHPIQPAFRDRMEIIRLSGYIEEEKIEIAKRHLIPKQIAEHGLTVKQLTFTDAGIRKTIRHYTKEAGVRNLEREIAKICRKVAVKAARGRLRSKISVSARSVESYLGAARHFNEELLDRDRVGVATGLAWTPVGGDLLFIEAAAVPGKGNLMLTGQLGKVMKESAQAAITYARSSSLLQDAPKDFFARHDIHIHVPAGAVPKDGPSAGITIATALVSLLTQKPVDRRVAMTGEITLRGDVLPIGGLKEKILAARNAGVRTVVIPKLNERDLSEIENDIKAGLTFHLVDHCEEAVEIALARPHKKKRRRAASRSRLARAARGA